MTIEAFSGTAAYYDRLYKDKEYAKESSYLSSLLQSYAPGVKTILEFGCGTGRYTREMAALGYDVLGVDVSNEMLIMANQLAHPGSSFVQGDFRTFRTGRSFDAVIAMFHVVSYLTKNDDLVQAFCSAADHLHPGGVFLFDCWYGPAVLTVRPTVRIRRVCDDDLEIVRISEPKLCASTSTVNVDYQLVVTDKRNEKLTTINETHHMRYLFEPELAFLLDKAGLVLEGCEEFLSGKPLDYETWYGCFLARKP